MAKDKMNKNRKKQKFQLKEQILPTPDKSADPPQPQGKNRSGNMEMK